MYIFIIIIILIRKVLEFVINLVNDSYFFIFYFNFIF